MKKDLMSVPPAPVEDQSWLRRAPSQRRSRERVERILAAAATLIAQGGSDAMRMSEVAAKAGVPIGSLYQYFPDKAAIIRTLAARYNAQGRACIKAELANVGDTAALRAAFGRLIDIYYRMFLSEPVLRDIWSGTQTDKGLRDLELEDSRLNASVLAEAMARVRPDLNRVELAVSAFLIMQLGEATMRLAISVKRSEGDALVEAYERMVLREIAPEQTKGRRCRRC